MPITLIAKAMRLLRATAILSNVAFMTYAAIEWLPPVFVLHFLHFLHLGLLSANIVRLSGVVGVGTDDISDRTIPYGCLVVNVQKHRMAP